MLFLTLTCLNGWAKQDEDKETQCGSAVAEKAARVWLSPEFRSLVRTQMEAKQTDAETVGQAIGVSRALIHKILNKPQTTLSLPTFERLAERLEIAESPECRNSLHYRPPAPGEWDYNNLPSKIVLNENFLELARAHRMGLHLRQEDLATRMGVSIPYIQHLLKGKIPVIRTRFYLLLLEALEMDSDTARDCLNRRVDFNMMVALRRAKNRFTSYSFEARQDSWGKEGISQWSVLLPEEIFVSSPFMQIVAKALKLRNVTNLQLREAVSMSKFKFAGLQSGKLPILKKAQLLMIVHLLSLDPETAISAALTPWTLESLPGRIPYTPEFRWLVERRRKATGHDYQSLSIAMGRHQKYFQKSDLSKSIEREDLINLMRVLDISPSTGLGFIRGPQTCNPKEPNAKCQRSVVTLGEHYISLVTHTPGHGDELVKDLLLLKAMMKARPETEKWIRAEWAERAAGLVFSSFQSQLRGTPKAQERILLALQTFVRLLYATEESSKEELLENVQSAARQALQSAAQARLDRPVMD